jgi:aspartyl-tRNA(Asn)/glutamyl-tRNA(Gln) amidotransferase subunit A
MNHSDRFTVRARLAGLPAPSLPMGLSNQGLPLGTQVIGNLFQEIKILKLAFWLENRVQLEKICMGRRKDE